MFITFEGIDGSGKTVQQIKLSEYLNERNISHILTKEPGGTQLAEEIRRLFLHNTYSKMKAETAIMLLHAARVEHLEEVIKPALRSGLYVLCDRFSDSTFAYQTALTPELWPRIDYLDNWLSIKPDLTILLDVDPKTAYLRRSIRNTSNNTVSDPYDSCNIDYFTKVRAVYDDLCLLYPFRIKKVDANLQIEDVSKSVISIFLEGAIKRY